MWRAPQREFVGVLSLNLGRQTIVKLAIVAAVLLTLQFSYDYLLSYLLWSPPGPVTSDPDWTGDHHDAGNTNASNQTLIPPLHQAWQTKLPVDAGKTTLSLGGGKLMAVSGLNAYGYDATNGDLLNQFRLFGSGYRSADSITSATISPDGSHVYYITNNASDNAASWSTTTNSWLSIINLNDGSSSEPQPLNSNASMVLDTQHNLLLTSSAMTTYSNGVYSFNYTIAALNPQTGAQVWRSEGLGLSGPVQIAVGGDTVYATLDNGNELVALDIRNGVIRWHRASSDPNPRSATLLADSRDVYLNSNYFPTIYKKDGVSAESDTQLYMPTNFGAEVLTGGQIIGTRFDQLASISATGESTFPYDRQNSGHATYNVNSMAASNGLLWLTVRGEGNLFGNTRLMAFDLQSGKQVWRSPSFNDDYANGAMVIGNGMLYLVYGGEIHAFAGVR